MYVISYMQSVIYNHAYKVFKSKTLPPNCVDIKAQIEAQKFVNLYTNTNRLTDFLLRYNRGAL